MRERERVGCRKLEGRRSRPGLVHGLADSLALSRRNASYAGEPLLSLSFFLLSAPSSFVSVPHSPSHVRTHATRSFLLPPRILRGFILLCPSSLFLQAPFHSLHSLLRTANIQRTRHTAPTVVSILLRISFSLPFPSSSIFLALSSRVSHAIAFFSLRLASPIQRGFSTFISDFLIDSVDGVYRW